MPTSHDPAVGTPPARISSVSLKIIAVVALIVFAGIFVLGYLPRVQRNRENSASAHEEQSALPIVNVSTAKQAPALSELQLPGNVQAIAESPVLARAEGYLVKRYADIGDRVVKGQKLAEIDAPDLDQQVIQARASLEQTNAALVQARANLEQAKANESLAEVTKRRNDTLVQRGVLSKQEGDTSTAAYQAQFANVNAGQANIAAAQQSVAAAQANLDRLIELQGYKTVRAPFAGVITLRNIDTGTLINSGSTMLFRVAQYDTLRIFLNVPQANFSSLKVGTPAQISVQELPGRVFNGQITRVSGALDTTTRTLLTEVQLRNIDGSLRPGMYATVRLSAYRVAPPVLIPGDAVVTRSNGTFVAVITPDDTAHFRPIRIGRDLGLDVEIASGINAGDQIVVNPTDDVREGVKVQKQFVKETPSSPAGQSSTTGKRAAGGR